MTRLRAFFLDILLLLCLPAGSWPMIQDQRKREAAAARRAG
jgi:hypothetical protein